MMKQKELQAFEQFYYVKYTLEYHDATHIPLYGLVVSSLGNVYYHFNDLKNAKKQYLLWMNQKTSYAYTPQSKLNSLGLILENEGELDSASHIYKKALYYSKSINDTVWYNIIHSNLAKTLIKQHHFEEAENLLNASLPNFKKDTNLYYLVGTSYVKLAIISLQSNDLNNARKELDSALLYFNKKHAPAPFFWFQIKSDYHTKNNELDSALIYFKRAQDIEDENIALLNPGKLNEKQTEFHKLHEKIEKEIHEKNLKSVKKTNSQVRLAFVLFSLFVSVFSIIYFIKLRIKNSVLRTREEQVKRELQSLSLETKELIDQLKNRDQLLQSFEFFIQRQKNDKEIDSNFEIKNVAELLSNSKIHTVDNWEQFKNLFNSIYPNFMVYLTEQHPKISETELRQSCLIRLNLSNEQMANIMAISKDSVRKSNQRLREKLQFKEQGALIDYLFSIPQ